MPIYEVMMYFYGNHKRTIEAKDDEAAEELAIFELNEQINVSHFEVTDAITYKASDQYTDQQELLDREEPHGR